MIPPIARRFVAGEDADAALARARELNGDGIGAILNLLGEHYDDRHRADADALAYLALVADVAERGLDACVSVKPSQLGLGVSEAAFRENLESVVERGRERDVFVWVDMEGPDTVAATLDAHEEMAAEYGGGVGVCVQANLARTREDVERLAGLPGKVRLVKGAYDPPPGAGYRSKAAVDRAFRELLEVMFRTFEGGIAVGSHDPAMLERAAALHAEYGTPYEVQMLMGVREDAQREHARRRPTYQYVPFGRRWLSYFWRRVRERRENALFALRALLGR